MQSLFACFIAICFACFNFKQSSYHHVSEVQVILLSELLVLSLAGYDWCVILELNKHIDIKP